ncbi:hypothetical protein Ocin01_19957 [Orchesella cincta]|uniref:Uncharacterized protein n=1 Tax=Orchesella cincta TaxID=48709 RepID=A0A1D2M181_ORCCI|nr:hypothetical protein Ocin01_19957 [Orchesella cincta]
MFLLKRKTELVLLMTIFGMLLSSVHIQPSQALMCYGCPETDTDEYWKCVDSDAALTTKITCPEGDMSCYENDIRFLNTSVMDPIPRISRGPGVD